MTGPRPVLRAGLTGGIASGKTTVAGFLAELGAFVLDADRIAHEVMEPGGTAHEAVVARFGTEVLSPDGRIRRPVLARLVFEDRERLEALNSIVHPRVMEETERRILHYQQRNGHARVVILDAALLVEAGLHRHFHRLIVVRCTRQSQMQRLLTRDRLTQEEATARIESQAPLEKKLALANYIIDTDTTLRETRRQTEQVYASLLEDALREFGDPGSASPAP